MLTLNGIGPAHALLTALDAGELDEWTWAIAGEQVSVISYQE